ncbi:hypothetical protein LTR95_018536, partial [Oleoguttula sp. CCFEE 5521]
TLAEIQKKIDEDEEQLAKIIGRLLRNKKILKLAEERAKRKALCLMNEMEQSGDLEVPEDCPAADAGTTLPPAV